MLQRFGCISFLFKPPWLLQQFKEIITNVMSSGNFILKIFAHSKRKVPIYFAKCETEISTITPYIHGHISYKHKQIIINEWVLF